MTKKTEAKKVSTESISAGSEGKMVPLQSIINKRDISYCERRLSGVGVDNKRSIYVWAYIKVRIEQTGKPVTMNDLRTVVPAPNLEDTLEELVSLRLIKRYKIEEKFVYSTTSDGTGLIKID